MKFQTSKKKYFFLKILGTSGEHTLKIRLLESHPVAYNERDIFLSLAELSKNIFWQSINGLSRI